MSEAIKLRPATIQDADCLLRWRNDPETRKASHDTAPIANEDHVAWLKGVLQDENRRLFVAEENGVAVGSTRADFAEGVWELSWTVAPEARGHGVAKRMVALMAQRISEPIRAEVRVGNLASARIAEYAGMEFSRESNGVLHYQRAASK